MQESVIRIEGAEALIFRCQPDDTILGGALRSGLGFPYECNSGAAVPASSNWSQARSLTNGRWLPGSRLASASAGAGWPARALPRAIAR